MVKGLIEKLANDPSDDESESYGMKNASSQPILAPLKDFRMVLRYRQKPKTISLVYIRNFARFIGLQPRFWKGETRYYAIAFIFLMVLIGVFAITVTCDLYDASKDLSTLCEVLVYLSGIYLIISEIAVSVYYSKDIEQIKCEFYKMNKFFAQLKESPSTSEIRKLQRLFFLIELGAFFFYNSVCALLAVTFSLCPILTHSGTIPFQAKFPFAVETFSENPFLFSSVYLFQAIMSYFYIQSVVVIDVPGCNIFTQTALNLKILCIHIRNLGNKKSENLLEELHNLIKFHQHLINLTAKINHVYYYIYVCQLVGSTLMICLTAFEAVQLQDQPIMALKYLVYMFAAFAELFYWCACGNLAYYSSLEVAEAAYDIEGWYEQSAEFGCCLRFLILRAQKPLIFQPTPFSGLTFDTFVSILSASYSYFALLRTMIE